MLTAAIVQASYWRDYATLLRHSTAAAPDNWLAHRMLGNVLADKGLTDEAVVQYRESIRIQPWNSYGHNNLAVELARQGKYLEAIEQYREALRLRPGWTVVRNNLQLLLAEQERTTAGSGKRPD